MNAPNALSPRALRHPLEPISVAAARGYHIPVRSYGTEGSRQPVVMLHGLQSHSGWFGQSAAYMAGLGHPVHAFDRCGSGVSVGRCEAGERLSGVLAEIDAVVEHALAETRHDRVHLVGHCFGAIPALLHASVHRPDRIASLILATPALYTRTDVRAWDKARILWSVLAGRPVNVEVPIAPEEFTDERAFVDFVENDPLIRTAFPARLLFEVRRARSDLPRAVRALCTPTLVAMAGDDAICDNERSRALLEGATAPMEFHRYDRARHILEFSADRNAFLGDLAHWTQRHEAA